MATAGFFVYHPLGPQSPLGELWRETTARRVEHPSVSPELQSRYRTHIAARFRGGAGLPETFAEDRRKLVQDFRAFFPEFLKRAGAPPDRALIPVSFPQLNVLDARVVEVKEQRAIFVSSRTLDAIELFARTMSLCTQLNGLAAPYLVGAEDPQPQSLLLAWVSFMGNGNRALADLLKRPTGQITHAVLTSEVFGLFKRLPEELRRASGRYQLTQFLAQAMLFAMERVLQGTGSEAEELLAVPVALSPSDAAATIDGRYLAVVVLTFVVLHEHGHLAHQHNSLEPMVQDPQINEIVEGMMRYAKEHPDVVVNARDLRGSTPNLEQDADCFAIEKTPEEYRHAMLEAATLWFSALASADRGGPDWLEKQASSGDHVYPQYAMRVWFLNGRYSTGKRQGEVAQMITRTAESIEASPRGRDIPTERLLTVFKMLWKMARAEVEPSVGLRMIGWVRDFGRRHRASRPSS